MNFISLAIQKVLIEMQLIQTFKQLNFQLLFLKAYAISTKTIFVKQIKMAK